MKEYIDVEKMEDIIHKWFVGYTIEDMIYDIKKRATTDAKEVVHAKWGRPFYIPEFGWVRECSKCIYSSSTGTKEFKPLFCSNCGATMDLE